MYAKLLTGEIYYKTWETNPEHPWLILLHDALGSVAQWKSFPEKLQQNFPFNILAYDRIGHGLSAEDKKQLSPDYLFTETHTLDELMGFLNIHQAHILGHSDGATLSLLFAAKHPKRCLKVVSIAAHVIVEETTLQGIRDTQKIYTQRLKPLLEKYHGSKTDALFTKWTSIWLNPSYAMWNMLQEIPNIQIPLLAFQGDSDEYGTAEQLRQIAKAPRATTTEIKNCKHYPQQEKPDEVMELLKTFF